MQMTSYFLPCKRNLRASLLDLFPSSQLRSIAVFFLFLTVMEDSTLSGGNYADNEVLSLLRDLWRDMQSMGDRVASLEGQPPLQSGHDADGQANSGHKVATV